LIIYHRVDMDGYFSAALVSLEFPELELVPADYNKNEVDVVALIKATKPEVVWIVDWSLPEEMFDEVIANAGKVIWIDHHERKINELEKLKDLPGLRRSDVSAAWLTAEYLNVLEKYDNHLLKMVSDYDTFNFNDADPMNAPCAMFNVGFMSMRTEDPGKMVDVVKACLEEESSCVLADFTERGAIILNDRINSETIASKNAIFKGNVAFVNATCNPNYFPQYIKGVNYIVVWYMLKDGRIKCNFRSAKEGGSDVSEIAAGLGGGGHKNAAGCVITMERFNKEFKLWDKK